MDPSAGWFAVAGALAAGVPQLVGTVIEAASKRGQRNHDAKEAKAAREAEAKEAQAQREHEQRQSEAEARRQKIREWRDGLAAAHREFKERVQGMGDDSGQHAPDECEQEERA